VSSAERVFRAMGHKQRHTQKTYVPMPFSTLNNLNQHASSLENDSGRYVSVRQSCSILSSTHLQLLYASIDGPIDLCCGHSVWQVPDADARLPQGEGRGLTMSITVSWTKGLVTPEVMSLSQDDWMTRIRVQYIFFSYPPTHPMLLQRISII
jgi:hypothetical protein